MAAILPPGKHEHQPEIVDWRDAEITRLRSAIQLLGRGSEELTRKWGRMRAAVRELYYAAYWSPDRNVDAQKLWENVRDAAGIEPGQTVNVLGPPRQQL